ncbi:hypothetical protein ESZ54_06580 [Vagococcus silagei]|uniref:Uncharacterized protein n=1 Tax=Vagococcus silagei TaxID=2508885 RepID=A0A4S3B2X6_9ENTE|nr:hypothetical protein ESZ54_06580 [Vagococcus silagei]
MIYKFSFVSMTSDNLLPEREHKEVLASVKNEFNDTMEIGHLISLSLSTEKSSQLVMAYLTEEKLKSQANQDQFVGVEVKFWTGFKSGTLNSFTLYNWTCILKKEEQWNVVSFGPNN